MTYKQKECQSFDQFMTELKILYSDCEFGELKKSLIKGIVGIKGMLLRARVLREPNLTLVKGIPLGQSRNKQKFLQKS